MITSKVIIIPLITLNLEKIINLENNIKNKFYFQLKLD